MLWGAGAYQGHTVPNYRRLLSDGIGKTLRYVKECAAQTDDSDKTDFYRALEIILKGFSSWVRIYADYAEKARRRARCPSPPLTAAPLPRMRP